MKIIHYIKVACHFWPWERAFWIGLLHDSIEDGWSHYIWRFVPASLHWDVLALSRNLFSGTYADYISDIQDEGGDVKRVKIADLLVNYERATPSLRKRYAKALLILADES